MKKLFGLLGLLGSFLLMAEPLPEKPLLQVFAAACRQNSGQNVLLSPWGIQQCFGMISGGAGKISGGELDRVLGLNKETDEILKSSAASLKKSRAKFNSFNAILFDRKYTVKKEFADHAVNFYGGKLYKVDFSRKAACVKMLNDIVKRESFNMFDKVFKESDLSDDLVVTLLNVLYFKDRWALPFEKYNTRKEKFYLPSQTDCRVDMMNDTWFLPYYNDGKYHGVVLSYADRRFKLLVLTSIDRQRPLNQTVDFLTGKGIQYIVKRTSRKNKTILKMPKLKLSSKLDLEKLFVPLGMKYTFHPTMGDLNNMVVDKMLYISQAEQLVKLNLDENGTEVAAVTYAMAKSTSAAPRKEVFNYFYADHPFVLVLFDSTTQAVLLTAAVNDPR